jgi:Bacterial PH domain
LWGVSAAPTEHETYTSPSSRITAGVVLAIGLLALVDIVIEWRTLGGVTAAALILAAMLITYAGLFRPSITLSPSGLLVRNHVRDHEVPWAEVNGVTMTDLLRIETSAGRLRCPAVQLVMRDIRKERAGRKVPEDSSSTRTEFVVSRVEYHQERYADSSTGEIVTRWAVPELIALAVLLLIAAVTWFAN